MAPYEHKTDSREFEIASPDEYRGGTAPADATEIAIRLWAASGSDRRVPPTWKTDSILVYMIADLVVASRGHIAEESPTLMTASFLGSRQALVAARRIQMAVLEFVACRPGGSAGAAILVYHPQASNPTQASDPNGFTDDIARRALRQSKPGQILLSESISQRLRDLPGIEFHVVPELASVSVHGALTELVWTTPERVAFLQDAVGTVAEPRDDEEAPPFGATMIVQSPFALPSSASDGMPPVMPTGDFVFKDNSEADSPQQGEVARSEVGRSEEVLTPRAEDYQDRRSDSLTAELDELKEQKIATRTWVFIGIVAIVLGGVLVALLYHPTNPSNVPVSPQPEQTRTKEVPIKVSPPATAPKTNPNAPTAAPESVPNKAQAAVPPEVVPKKPQAKVPAVAVPPQASSRKDSRANDGNETSAAPAPVYEYGGFSQKDIPKLLEFAKTDAGKGNYGSAREEYSTVLKLQPSNQAAKDGLHKLDLIQQDQ
jgi:hypothetical protein